MQEQTMKRGAGFLLPITALPAKYGIGTLGAGAYEWIDFVYEAGCSYWQVLPVGPTSYGDSPYQSFSAFAGNPYFIDLDILISEGLLRKEEAEALAWGSDETDVDYGTIYENRYIVLKKAYERSRHKETPEYAQFLEKHAFWLHDYSLYMAVKEHFGNKAWQEWEEDIKMHLPEAVRRYEQMLAKEIDFWKFCQFQFDIQWTKLKAYAGEKGIEIIGDIPLYVSMDSADVWAHSELFELDELRREINIAGVPPDLFSATGQRWGNPLYRWDVMEHDWFYWWRERMRYAAMKYDVIRIDHFIGIVNYYSIPAECKTAMEGEWKPGPGKVLMDMLGSALGDTKVIAEDLGILTQNVKDVIEYCKYPGMKVLEFGLDMQPDNPYLPHNFSTDRIVAYIGTHDNETLEGFLKGATRENLAEIAEYFNAKDKKDIRPAMIKALYASNANVVIFQVQDLLGLGNEARTNHPSTIGTNWRWRMKASQYAQIDTAYYKHLATIYNRYTAPVKEETK